MKKIYATIGAEKRALALASPGKLIGWSGMAKGGGEWRFCLSYEASNSGWFWSACLWPHGRGSTDEDWGYLGRIAATVGAPNADKVIGNTIMEQPNAVHKWIWSDDPDHQASIERSIEFLSQHNDKIRGAAEELAVDRQHRGLPPIDTHGEVVQELKNNLEYQELKKKRGN